MSSFAWELEELEDDYTLCKLINQKFGKVWTKASSSRAESFTLSKLHRIPLSPSLQTSSDLLDLQWGSEPLVKDEERTTIMLRQGTKKIQE